MLPLTPITFHQSPESRGSAHAAEGTLPSTAACSIPGRLPTSLLADSLGARVTGVHLSMAPCSLEEVNGACESLKGAGPEQRSQGEQPNAGMWPRHSLGKTKRPPSKEFPTPGGLTLHSPQTHQQHSLLTPSPAAALGYH